MASCQKLDIILPSKVNNQKISITKNVLLNSYSSMKKNQKDLDSFWHRKLTLKSWDWNFSDLVPKINLVFSFVEKYVVLFLWNIHLCTFKNLFISYFRASSSRHGDLLFGLLDLFIRFYIQVWDMHHIWFGKLVMKHLKGNMEML